MLLTQRNYLLKRFAWFNVYAHTNSAHSTTATTGKVNEKSDNFNQREKMIILKTKIRFVNKANGSTVSLYRSHFRMWNLLRKNRFYSIENFVVVGNERAWYEALYHKLGLEFQWQNSFEEFQLGTNEPVAANLFKFDCASNSVTEHLCKNRKIVIRLRRNGQY